MPNICDNALTITGSKEELDRFLTAARGKTTATKQLAFSLHALFPMPAPFARQKKGDIWYLDNWGTREILETYALERRSGEEAFIGFTSAWTPPLEAFTKKIAIDFPKLTFTLNFEEGGNDLCGESEWTGGRLVREDNTPCEQWPETSDQDEQ